MDSFGRGVLVSAWRESEARTTSIRDPSSTSTGSCLVVVTSTMAITIDSAPNSSTRSYSGVINSVLIQTEDGRRLDSSIQYNRIRDYSTTVYLNNQFQPERTRSGKPIILLTLAIFVTVWLFSESNLFAVFPLSMTDHKLGKPKVENGDWGDWVQAFYESENGTDVGDALDEDDDHLQSDSEIINEVQTTAVVEEDHKVNVTTASTTDDDDDVLGEDDNFEGNESKLQSTPKEESGNVSATNINATATNISATATTIDAGENATKYNL